ncbi:thioredoxin-like protein, partial [Cladochytrium replicatum]
VAVIKWTASWCPPCKMIAPVYSQLAQKFPQVETVEVDVDKVQDAARMNGITAMPTFQFYVNGQLADSLQGADRRTLENLMAKYA